MLPILEVQDPKGLTPLQMLKAQMGKLGGDEHAFGVDLRALHPTGVPLPTLARLCTSLLSAGLRAVPVINSDDAFAGDAALVEFKNMPMIVLRLAVRTTPLAAALDLIANIRRSTGKRTEMVVVVDLGAIGDSTVANLTALVEPFVRAITASGHTSRVVVAGGSFPFTLAGLPQGAQTHLPRKEWSIWEQLVQRPGCSTVRFGDYAVTNPQPLEVADPTKINPSAAIRYALRDNWWLLRAAGVYTGGFHQYNSLCRLLIRHQDYAGKNFSYGDDRYHYHAQPDAKSGNLMTWRRDATCHHLVQTVRQLP